MNLIEDIIKEIQENWVYRHFDEQQRDIFIGALYNRNIKNCLETGFASGTSSATKPDKMVSVSLAFNDMEVATKLTNQYNFKLVVGDSTQILNKEFMDEEFPNGIDFYHVDGGHEGSVPFLDLQVCLDHLNDNFLIIVDDYHSKQCPLPDVDAAVDAFIQQTKFKMEPIVTESGKGMAFITKE